MEQPPSTPEPKPLAAPDERYRLDRADKVLFGIVLGFEVLLLTGYSGCALLLSGEFGGWNPFLLPVPIFLFCHIMAYRNYSRMQTQPSRAVRNQMQLFLFAPFLVTFLAFVLLMLGLQNL